MPTNVHRNILNNFFSVHHGHKINVFHNFAEQFTHQNFHVQRMMGDTCIVVVEKTSVFEMTPHNPYLYSILCLMFVEVTRVQFHKTA